MYEACGEGFPEPTEYLRQMLTGDAGRRHARARPGPTSTTGRSPACRASPRGRVSGATVSRASSLLAAPAARSDLALDKTPFLGRAQHRHQFLEQRGIAPGRIRTRSGNRRARRDRGSDRAGARSRAGISGWLAMWCDLSSKIRRRSSWVRSHHAADFLIGISAAQRRLGPAEPGLHRRELLLLGALDIAHMAGDAGQPPGGLRRQDRQRDRLGCRRPTAPASSGSASPLTARHRDDPPGPALPASEGREHGAMEAWNRAGFKGFAVIPGRAKHEPGIHSRDRAMDPGSRLRAPE